MHTSFMKGVGKIGNALARWAVGLSTGGQQRIAPGDGVVTTGINGPLLL